jgi:monofunctional glycosyltransferase
MRRKRHGKKIIRSFKSILKWLMLSIAGVFVLLLATIMVFRFIDPPTWSWKIQRELNPPVGYPAVSHHQWRDISQIPPVVQLAVIASEDQNFPLHHGVDFDAIQQVIDDIDEGKTLRGASTITQQTVKNLFLWPQKNWSRKILEGGLALLLELLWDKQRILEVYLNIVEFGPGIYGVAAASDYWYQRPLDRLSVNQASRLAAILPNPWRYRAEPASPYISERATWIEQQMDMLGYVWLVPVTGN